MNKKLILHAAQLATPTGKSGRHGGEMAEIKKIEDAAVLIEEDRIALVGTTEEVLKKVDAGSCECLDASGKTILPGFVDSHTHFVFAGYREEEFSWRLRGDSYLSIMERGGGINKSVIPTRAASVEDFLTLGRDRLDEMLQYGVTTVEGKSGYGMDHDTELRMLEAMKQLDAEHPIDIVRTFLGPHSVLPEWKGRERDFLDFLLEKVLPEVKEKRLCDFVDIFTETGVFNIEDSRYYLEKARAMGFPLKMHADEIAENFGGTELGVSLGAVSVDHLLKCSAQGIRDLSTHDTIATLLPLTAFSLKEPYADARKMIDSGCAVALASDLNPGSCFSNSIPLLIALSCIYMKMSIEEVITALTLNGAAALQRADQIGSLEEGKYADLLLLHFPSIHFLPYHTGVNQVDLVIKKGNIVCRREKAMFRR